MSTDRVHPETLVGDPFAAELAEAIREDEDGLGRPHTPGEREAFSAGFRERREEHHAVPRCLLRLHDEARSAGVEVAGGIEPWLEFEWECMRWGVDVEISRADLAALIEASAVLLDRDEHRRLHETDWQRWGRRGGLATLRLYGTSWYSALARKRWGKIGAEDLARARVAGGGLAGEGSAA